MPDATCRRLNLFDGMILVAGMASCFPLTRFYLDEYAANFTRNAITFAWLEFSTDWIIGEAAKVATLWLAMLSPVLLLIRLRPPRPNRIDLFAQPGASASLVSTLLTALGIPIWTAAGVIVGQGPGLFFDKLTFSRLLAQVGSAILMVWIVQALSHQWRPEPSWIDRAGRFLAIGWIVVFLALTWSQFHQKIVVDRPPHNGRYYFY